MPKPGLHRIKTSLTKQNMAVVSAQVRQAQSCNCLIPQELVRAEKDENSQVWDGLHSSSKGYLELLGEEDSGSISGDRTEVMAPRHLFAPGLSGWKKLVKSWRSVGPWAQGYWHFGTSGPRGGDGGSVGEEDQGATVTGGQAEDPITREAKTVDTTRVPLNCLPGTGTLGAGGLSPAQGLCGAGEVTQLIKCLVCRQGDQSSDTPILKKKADPPLSVTPAPGGLKQADLCSPLASLEKPASSRISKRFCLKIRWRRD